MQEKTQVYEQQNTQIRETLSANLKILLELNRKKNFQKKADFFRDLPISSLIFYSWVNKKALPANTTISRITDYFNKWLDMDLSMDDLLHKDLESILNSNGIEPAKTVNEQSAPYLKLTPREQRMLETFRRLNPGNQEFIIEVAKKIPSK